MYVVTAVHQFHEWANNIYKNRERKETNKDKVIIIVVRCVLLCIMTGQLSTGLGEYIFSSSYYSIYIQGALYDKRANMM